jgi:hypothetical protein
MYATVAVIQSTPQSFLWLLWSPFSIFLLLYLLDMLPDLKSLCHFSILFRSSEIIKGRDVVEMNEDVFIQQ